MKTTTRYHELTTPTVTLAATLKRLESRPRTNRLRDWMIEQMRKELRLRAQSAMNSVLL